MKRTLIHEVDDDNNDDVDEDDEDDDVEKSDEELYMKNGALSKLSYLVDMPKTLRIFKFEVYRSTKVFNPYFQPEWIY